MDDEDPLRLLLLAVEALEAVRMNLGLHGLIDATAGSGMSHLGYSYWLKAAKSAIEKEPPTEPVGN
jgi:hypothetical protein